MRLRQLLTDLASRQQIKKITDSVAADGELAAICRREFSRQHSGVLLFTDVAGSTVRVVANMFAGWERLLQLFQTDEQTLLRQISSLLVVGEGSASVQLASKCHASQRPLVATDCCEQRLTLQQLPALRSWPREQHPYLTLALTHTQHPLTEMPNLGLYRGAIVGSSQIALNFAPGSGAESNYRVAQELNQPLPVALILGSNPALVWGAAAPLPDNCSEYAFIEQVLGQPTYFTNCLTQPLQVPADAEIVIEGYIAPGALTAEGPFGNHRGQYIERSDCPLMTVTAIRHRPRPIMPVTVVGPPPSENINLGKLNELLIRELLRFDEPLISDFVMPEMTIFHGVGLIAVQECSDQMRAELIARLNVKSYFAGSKALLLIDDDVDIRDFNKVWWRAVNQLETQKIYLQQRPFIMDATGVDRSELVLPDPALEEGLGLREYAWDLPTREDFFR